jgi:hypothetical protein
MHTKHATPKRVSAPAAIVFAISIRFSVLLFRGLSILTNWSGSRLYDMTSSEPNKNSGLSAGDSHPQDGNRDKGGRFSKGNSLAFQKGQSGNPGGRPKGQSITARLRAILERDDGMAAQMIAETLIETAMQGDRRAIEAVRVLLDRTEGPVSQRIAVDHGVVHKTVVIGDQSAAGPGQLSSPPNQMEFIAPESTVNGGARVPESCVQAPARPEETGSEGSGGAIQGANEGEKEGKNTADEEEQATPRERTGSDVMRVQRGPAQTTNVEMKEVAKDPDLIENLENKLAMSEAAESELRAALLDEELRKELQERGE